MINDRVDELKSENDDRKNAKHDCDLVEAESEIGLENERLHLCVCVQDAQH